MVIDLFIRYKEKFRKDQMHTDYLLAKGLDPVEITDRLIHIMFDLMREGLKNQDSNLSDEEIFQKMRKHAEDYEKLKRLQKRRI